MTKTKKQTKDPVILALWEAGCEEKEIEAMKRMGITLNGLSKQYKLKPEEVKKFISYLKNSEHKKDVEEFRKDVWMAEGLAGMAEAHVEMSRPKRIDPLAGKRPIGGRPVSDDEIIGGMRPIGGRPVSDDEILMGMTPIGGGLAHYNEMVSAKWAVLDENEKIIKKFIKKAIAGKSKGEKIAANQKKAKKTQEEKTAPEIPDRMRYDG